MLSESFFWELGHKFTKHHLHLSPAEGMKRFKNFYGVSPNICNILWSSIEGSVPETCEPKHLLWTLCFSKQYNNEAKNRAIFGTDEKTYRKYVWLLIDVLADLDIIKFEERLVDSLPGQRCFASLDGEDFKVREPKPFNKDYFSHKFKASALRYEVGLALKTGNIVWAFGGYPAGLYPDLKLKGANHG